MKNLLGDYSKFFKMLQIKNEQIELVIFSVKIFIAYIMTLIIFVMLPGGLKLSSGIQRIYMKVLVYIFEFVRRNSVSKDEIYKYDDCDSNKCKIPEENINLEFNNKKPFELIDVSKFANAAIKAIVDDNVTKRFTAEELPSWNLMSRSYLTKHYINISIRLVWIIGAFYRYFILFPLRFTLMGLTTLFLVIVVLGVRFIPFNNWRIKYIEIVNIVFCRLCLTAIGAFPQFHDIQYKSNRGVVVANHTTPMDALVLGSDCFYRYVAQLQPGYFSFLQQQLSHLGHIFFERKDVLDRNAVSECIKKTSSDNELPPVIIFPEGTCINNTSVMLFRKGTFEVCDTVYPVAIKYNPMFGDPFWNSSTASYGWYLINLASSWLVHCDVWYLPPITKLPNEQAAIFASRVQKAIAEKANIVHLGWDGNLKRTFVPPYLKSNKQKEYAQSLIITHDSMNLSPKISDVWASGEYIKSHEALLFENEDNVTLHR